MESGRKVAALVSADPMLAQLLPCSATGGPACADTFVTTIGTKLYRRPLTAAEKARYLALFDKVGKHATSSPSSTGRRRRCCSRRTSSTAASWASPTARPLQADALRGRQRAGLHLHRRAAQRRAAAAGGGQPAGDRRRGRGRRARPDLRRRQTVRPGLPGRASCASPISGWGSPRCRTSRRTTWPSRTSTPRSRTPLGEETRRFISSVLLEEKGTRRHAADRALHLRRRHGWPSTTASARPTGTDFARVEPAGRLGRGPAGPGLDAGHRGAQPDHLADQARAPGAHAACCAGRCRRRRRWWTRCPSRPRPRPPASATRSCTWRTPAATACHQMMDPIGFAFEHLDAAGRFRAKEGKFDIDDSGVVTGTSAGDLTFRGPTELASALATLPEMNDCLAAYVAAYAFGVSHENAACLVSAATGRAAQGRRAWSTSTCAWPAATTSACGNDHDTSLDTRSDRGRGAGGPACCRTGARRTDRPVRHHLHPHQRERQPPQHQRGGAEPAGQLDVAHRLLEGDDSLLSRGDDQAEQRSRPSSTSA